MQDELRVRDLASRIHWDPKELVRALREIGVQSVRDENSRVPNLDEGTVRILVDSLFRAREREVAAGRWDVQEPQGPSRSQLSALAKLWRWNKKRTPEDGLGAMPNWPSLAETWRTPALEGLADEYGVDAIGMLLMLKARSLHLSEEPSAIELQLIRRELEQFGIRPKSGTNDAAQRRSLRRVEATPKSGAPARPRTTGALAESGKSAAREAQELIQRIDALERRLAGETTKSHALAATGAEFREMMQGIEGRAGLLVQRMDRMESRMSELERFIADLQAIVGARDKRPDDFTACEARASRLLDPSRASPATRFEWPDATRLRARLRERGARVSEATADNIVRAIQRSRVVVLSGAPGTGKSLIANEVARAILGSHGGESACEFVNLHPDYSSTRLIGGVRKIGQHFGPALGPLTECVFRCLEGNPHWLVLDEINRCDTAAVITPLFDALSREEGRFEHPHLFASRSDPRASIPIPASMRVLATMNTFDQHLFAFDDATKRRISLVEIEPLDGDDERDLMRERLRRWLEFECGFTPEQTRTHEHQMDDVLDVVCSVATDIRGLRTEGGAGHYRNCEIGSGLLEPVLREVSNLRRSGRLEGLAAERHADVALAEVFVHKLAGSSIAALASVRDRVFRPRGFELTCSALTRILEERSS